eukprot:s2557_g5.t1
MTLRGLVEYFVAPQLQCLSAGHDDRKDEFQVADEASLTIPAVSHQSEPRPSARALAVETELLRHIGLHPFAEPQMIRETTPREAAQLLLQSSLEFRLSLLEIEPLVLPPWIMDAAFPSRDRALLRGCCACAFNISSRSPQNGEDFDKTISNDDADYFFGEFGKTSACHSGPPLFRHPDLGCSQSCRWAELLNGVAAGSDLSGLCLDRRMVPERLRVTQVLLSAMRLVPWSTKYAWIFPDWHRHRMSFLSWVGKDLGFGSFLWAERVLPFLPIEPYYPEGWALEFASAELQADRDVVLTAVKKTGEALRYARQFCGDYEVAFAAAQNCGLVLALLEPHVQDAALVLAAIRQDARAMDFVELRLRPAVQEALGLPYSPWGAAGAAPNPETTCSKARLADPLLKPHFAQLGLPETASVEEVRQSFRRLALRYHPDKNSEDVGRATEAFQRINKAYTALREAFGE